MKREKAVRFVKCTSRFITVTLLAVALIASCSSFSLITKAAESDSVWNIPEISSHRVYRYDTGKNQTTASLNFIVNESNYYIASQSPASYTLPDTEAGPITLTYAPFTYSLSMTGATSSAPTGNYYIDTSLLGNVVPCIYDNLGNRYPLDAVNGGTITIEDLTDITILYLNFYGPVKGTQTYQNRSFRYLNILCSVSAFDITLSKTAPLRTITDSEGTVWTVPEGVENPVVVGNSTAKQLVDASDLMYLKDEFDRLHFASYTVATANLYDPDGSLYETIGVRTLQEGYSVPVYISAYYFDSFLYGSLPEMSLEKLPEPTPEPGDKADSFEEIYPVRTEFKSDSNPYNDLVLYSTEDNEPKNNWFTTWDEETKDYEFWSSKRTLEAVDGNNDFYHTHFDETVSYPLIFYTSSRAPYDGYCVVSFPKGLSIVQPEDANVMLGTEYLTSWHIQVEIQPYLLVQGERYDISDFACSFSFQVYEEEPFSFAIGYEAHIRSEVTGTVPVAVQWRCPFEISRHAVSVWYYSDDEELSQILDKLENFPDADKMDDAASNLDSAIKDYDDAENSIFESATEGIDNFDISSGFEFNAGILSAIGFIGTIISSIIVAMGDFSFLYTIGVCLVIVSVIVGLFKYFGGGEDD